MDDKEFGEMIFSYGTLVDKFPEAVVEEAYIEGRFELDDRGMFPAVRPSDHKSVIEGHLMKLTPDQIKIADKYEEGLYDRVEIEVNRKAGGSVKAQVYIEF